MSGCNRVMSLVGVTTSKCLRSSSASSLQPLGASRILRNLSHSTTIRPLCWRHHQELNLRKDRIRTHIRTLELGRRRFATTPVNGHGHIDPPKPGEEYVTFPSRDGRTEKLTARPGCMLLSSTRMETNTNSRCPKEKTCST